MADWAEESPSDEDELTNIEHELYSMFYYHSMSDGLPSDLAEKFHVDMNDFGVTISLKNNSNDNYSEPTPNNGFEPESLSLKNDRYIEGRYVCSSLVDKKLSSSSGPTEERKKDFEVLPDKLELPSSSFIKKSTLNKSRYFSIVKNDSHEEISVINKKRNSVYLPDTKYKKDSLVKVPAPHNYLRAASSFKNHSGYHKDKINKNAGNDCVLTKENTVIDLTINCPNVTSKKNKTKYITEKKQLSVITISSDSEIELSSSEDSNSDTDIDEGKGEIFDSILLNTSSPSYLNNFEAAVINTDYDWRQTSSPPSWTQSMKKFYNKPSKKHLDFDYEDILLEMRKDGRGDWSICQADLFSSRRPRKIRCIRCQQEGHVKANCTKIFSCHMCGTQGHSSKNCPNIMCLNCGSKHHKFFLYGCNDCSRKESRVCSVCGIKGHTAEMCTNAWRTFQPINSEKSNNSKTRPKYCCHCAKSGHYYEDCQKLNISNKFMDHCGDARPRKIDGGKNIKGKRRRKVSGEDIHGAQVILPTKHKRTKKLKFRSKIVNTFKNRKFCNFNSNEKIKKRNLSKRILMLRKSNKKNNFKTHYANAIQKM